jgi:hypothetical protein
MTDYVYHNTSYNDGKFKINLADGTGSFKYIGTHGGSGESNTKFYFGDFNGDGMTDYVYHNTSYNDGKFKINSKQNLDYLCL